MLRAIELGTRLLHSYYISYVTRAGDKYVNSAAKSAECYYIDVQNATTE